MLERLALLRELREAASLRPFRFILSSMIANAAVMGLLATLATYMLTFFWQLEGVALGVQLSTGMSGGVFGALIASPVPALFATEADLASQVRTAIREAKLGSTVVAVSESSKPSST